MSVHFKNTTLLFLGILLSTTLVHAEKAYTEDRHAGIIVLDPGHGGNDMGARGSDNMTEKQVAMTFAGLMTERLKKTYKVFLTRRMTIRSMFLKDRRWPIILRRIFLSASIPAAVFATIQRGYPCFIMTTPQTMPLLSKNRPPI